MRLWRIFGDAAETDMGDGSEGRGARAGAKSSLSLFLHFPSASQLSTTFWLLGKVIEVFPHS